MATQDETRKALAAAYKDSVKKLFGIYANTIGLAEESEVEAAAKRFKAGLENTQKAYADCIQLSGIE